MQDGGPGRLMSKMRLWWAPNCPDNNPRFLFFFFYPPAVRENLHHPWGWAFPHFVKRRETKENKNLTVHPRMTGHFAWLCVWLGDIVMKGMLASPHDPGWPGENSGSTWGWLFRWSQRESPALHRQTLNLLSVQGLFATCWYVGCQWAGQGDILVPWNTPAEQVTTLLILIAKKKSICAFCQHLERGKARGKLRAVTHDEGFIPGRGMRMVPPCSYPSLGEGWPVSCLPWSCLFWSQMGFLTQRWSG